MYVKVATWTQVIYLKYTHEHEGSQGVSASAYISGKSQVLMLQLICYTYVAHSQLLRNLVHISLIVSIVVECITFNCGIFCQHFAL